MGTRKPHHFRDSRKVATGRPPTSFYVAWKCLLRDPALTMAMGGWFRAGGPARAGPIWFSLLGKGRDSELESTGAPRGCIELRRSTKLEWGKDYIFAFTQPLPEILHFFSLKMLTRNHSILKVLVALPPIKFILFYSFTYTLTYHLYSPLLKLRQLPGHHRILDLTCQWTCAHLLMLPICPVRFW